MKLYHFLLIGCLAAACSENNSEDLNQEKNLYEAPGSAALNMDEGYVVNQATGDSLPLVTNNSGDTVISGTPIELLGQLNAASDFLPPERTKALPFESFEKKPAFPNRVKESEIETVVSTNVDSLNSYGFNFDPVVLDNSLGDTIETGVPFKVKGKEVPLIQPERVDAKAMAMKVESRAGVRYLDVEQGLPAHYAMKIYEDKRGNMWIGTWGEGICRYDGSSLWQYTPDNGLIGRNIRDILEDKDGNLWIGTWGDGFCKFDGQTFTHYGEEQGLACPIIWNMFLDSEGNIWIGTAYYGVLKYDGENFTHYTTNEGIGGVHTRSFYEDDDGSIYMGAMGGAVSRYKDGKFSIYLTEKGGLISNDVRAVFKDSKGNMWIGSTAGLCRFDGKNIHQYSSANAPYFTNIQEIVEDNSGNIWLASEKNGLTVYDGTFFTNLSKDEGLTDNEIWSIEMDDVGNIWAGTNAGVNHIYSNSFLNFTEESGLVNNVVWTLTEDSQGRLWFGTTGWGISVFDGETFTNFSTEEGLPSPRITDIVEDRQGNMWFATARTGLIKYDGESFYTYNSSNGFCETHIWDIFCDSNGDLWIATDGMGLFMFDGENFTHYNENNGFFSSQIYTTYEDTDGYLWFGTKSGAIQYDHKFFTAYTTKEGLSDNSICDISQDASGAYWFISDNEGIMKLDGSTFSYFRTEQGLTSNATASIEEDKHHNLWVSSTHGFSQLIPQEDDSYRIVTYQKEDGLNSVSLMTDAVTRDKNDNLWWGTGKGVIQLSSDHQKGNLKQPEVQLNNILINEQQYDFTHAITDDSLGFICAAAPDYYNYPTDLKLEYDKNHLTFFYSAIDWNAPGKMMYSHKIEGLSNSWSKPTSEIKAEYRNIPYGKYTFKVRAINESGKWTEPHTYTFEITPPWWHRWWARILYVLIALIAVLGFVKWRTAKLQKRQKELEHEVEIATHEIREQHEEIMDSIAYAKRIQTAILPPTRIVKEYLKDSFILYKPKDVVAGDFYWMEQKNGKTLFAAADCTGHGVPGAMVSVICNNALNRSVREHGNDDPGKILDKAREIVISEFEKSDEEVKDGMDIALCSLKGMTLEYAGAHNPLWIVRGDEIIETKANKQPIGKFDKLEPYTTHTFELQAGDTFYIFSDGFVDQFGGEKGKKFKAKAFRALLLRIQDKGLEEQRKIIDDVFEDWRGSIEQIDDVCVIGVRV